MPIGQNSIIDSNGLLRGDAFAGMPPSRSFHQNASVLVPSSSRARNGSTHPVCKRFIKQKN